MCFAKFTSLLNPQQTRFPQNCQKIVLNIGKAFSDDRTSRDEHHIYRVREAVLVQPKAFSQQASGPVSDNRASNAGRSDDAQTGMGWCRKRPPVGNETTDCQSLAFLAQTFEVPSMLNPLGSAESQSASCVGGHRPSQKDYTGVNRLRPARRRLRRMALPLLLELRLRNPCCRLRRILDG
jgi:hypothetical protein